MTLCHPMNHSTPGLPVHHQLLEFTQTHVHRVSDAIQPSHPRLSPFPPAPNPSLHESFPMSQLFTWGGQSIGVSASASVLPMNITPLVFTYLTKSVPFHHSLSFSYVPTAESGNKKSILIFYELWFCLLDSTYEWDHVDLYFSVLHFA